MPIERSSRRARDPAREGKGSLRTPLRLVALLSAAAFVAAACSSDDGDAVQAAASEGAADLFTVTEDTMPSDFEPAPEVEFGGETWEFDTIPGHYWKLLNDEGYAVGLHFQTSEPFQWATDAEEGELLYIVYAIPGHCRPGGSFDKAVKADDATIQGEVLPGFDHWHGVVGAGPEFGHWLMHLPVRDFTLAGPPGNPMEGTPITGGIPQFMPICEPQ